MSESWRFGCREWGGVTDDLEFALLARLREVVEGAPASEVELRKLSEQGDAWARTLEGQIRASERRLRELAMLVLAGELALVSAELRHLGPLARPLVARPHGALFWGGSVLAGQVVPLLLNLVGRGAALSHLLVLVGGWLTRWVVVQAGKTSADDPQAAFAYHR
jgi:hypothetical protein